MTPVDAEGTVTDHGALIETFAWRRHLIVLGVAIIGLVTGIVLVVTGRQDPSVRATSSSPSTITTVAAPLLASLGTVSDSSAAVALLRNLEPETLRPSATTSATVLTEPAPSTTEAGVDATVSGVQRCGQAIAQQTTDRSLGKRLAAARLRMGSTTTFVVSYALPASDHQAAAARILLVDARTCRVLAAVAH